MGGICFSADTGRSLQILFHFAILSGRLSKDGSILTAWELLTVHPRVEANCALMGLGRSFKKDHLELFNLW